jgi:DNA-binding transcriptional MerR regulator
VLDADNVIAAFCVDHVERLTGLTKGRLRYWDRIGFFAPSYADDDRRSPYSRIYSFRDIVGLRTLCLLRDNHHVSLQHLQQVAEKLSHLANDLWSSTTLYVLERKVIFDETGTGRLREVVSGQYVNGLALEEVISDVRRGIAQLRRRSETQIGQITRSRFINHNALVIAGTRIPIAAIRRFREAGYTVEQIIREYPDLTTRDVEAALTYEERPGAAA